MSLPMRNLLKLKSFIFDTNEYSRNWNEADNQGLVPIFQLDGSVTFVEEDQAELAWQEDQV